MLQNARAVPRENQLMEAEQPHRLFHRQPNFADPRQTEEVRSPHYAHRAEQASRQFFTHPRPGIRDGGKVRLGRGQMLAALGQIFLRHFVVKIDHRP